MRDLRQARITTREGYEVVEECPSCGSNGIWLFGNSFIAGGRCINCGFVCIELVKDVWSTGRNRTLNGRDRKTQIKCWNISKVTAAIESTANNDRQVGECENWMKENGVEIDETPAV